MNGNIGIDIGGTAIKIGLVSLEGAILAKKNLSFAPVKPFPELINAVCSTIEDLMNSAAAAVGAIGIATPGFADPASGILIDGTQNVSALQAALCPENFPKRLRIPSFIENDGTCAALGELQFGAGRKFQNFVVITLGTGIGGGIVVNGDVVTGVKGTPPEIGAHLLRPEGARELQRNPGNLRTVGMRLRN